MSTITSLEISNTLRIKAARIEADGKPVVVIGGRNDQGKTSVLNAIMSVLGGKDMRPGELLRRGEEKGEIEVTTQDFVARLRITKAGQTLTVTNREGAQYPSPQAFLDKLCSKIAFDPLAFVRLGETPAGRREQLKQLRDLVGVDTRELDEARKKAFDARTELNRRAATQESIISDYPATGPERVDVTALMAEMKRMETANAQKNEALSDVEVANHKADRANEDLQKAVATVRRLEDELGKARVQVEHARKALEDADVAAGTSEEYAKSLPSYNLDTIRASILKASETNSAADKVARRKTEEGKLNVLRAEIDVQTTVIKGIDEKRLELIRSAQMPIPGLGFNENEVTFNGIPLDQASSAGQLRVGLAIAIAMNPKLPVMLIRNGSLLDSDSMAIVREMAEKSGSQVWIEVVGKGDGCSVIIEDGEVVS